LIGDGARERLQAWSDKSEDGVLSKNILFNRDSGGGSLCSKFENDANAVEAAYHEATRQKSNLTFVCVGKRHNTRFFPCRFEDTVYGGGKTPKGDKKEKGNDRNSNLEPGLVVKDVITIPNYDNFYLQSHNAIKGSAHPCHYAVLRDGIGFGETLQDLVSPSQGPPTYLN
jgi:eukaryotic translation initiation factor 2C